MSAYSSDQFNLCTNREMETFKSIFHVQIVEEILIHFIKKPRGLRCCRSVIYGQTLNHSFELKQEKDPHIGFLSSYVLDLLNKYEIPYDVIKQTVYIFREKEQSRWRLSFLPGVLILASLINCICRQELFLNTHHFKQFHYGYEIPLILTILETVTFAVLVTANTHRDVKSISEGIFICAFAHIKSNFLFSYWISLDRKSSFVFGYLEPIVLTMLLRICTGSEVRAGIMVSLGLVSLGATLSLGDMSAFINIGRTVIVIFLYIFFISLRNITLKHLKEESLTFSPRKRLIVPYTVATFVIGYISSAFYLSEAVIPMMLALVTIFTSVFILYLTTLMVQLCDVTFLSAIGVWIQVILNVAVLTQNYVHNVALAIFGTAILVGGTYLLLLYSKDTESNVCGLQQEVSHHEMYTRMEFLLFAGSAMGLFLYVLQPKISERDMQTFHVFGFESFMRKLLFNKQSTQAPS